MPTVQHIAKRVRAAHEHTVCFVPAQYLPVRIDPANRENPYSLAQDVFYGDGVVSVQMRKGFAWDGASIPYWWPLIPWLLTLGLHEWRPGWLAWLITTALLAYTLRLLPWMQKMGRHARAACVHDELYRTRQTARAIADAIFLEIMRLDQVPIDIRYQIYLNVRLFGWTAYSRRSAPAPAAAAPTAGETIP